MGKNQHSKDKMYITRSEVKNFHRLYYLFYCSGEMNMVENEISPRGPNIAHWNSIHVL